MVLASAGSIGAPNALIILAALLRKRCQLNHRAREASKTRYATHNRDPELATVRGRGDTIQMTVTKERSIQVHLPNCHYGAILPHTDNGVVTSVGYEKIGINIESGVAGPVDVFRLHLSRGHIDRLV
jgi:hypothetical protein